MMQKRHIHLQSGNIRQFSSCALQHGNALLAGKPKAGPDIRDRRGSAGGTTRQEQAKGNAHAYVHQGPSGLDSLVSTLAAASPALADETAPPSDFKITGSAAVVSQYRFRGISQSNNRPAVQGAITVAHSSGFYVSTWGRAPRPATARSTSAAPKSTFTAATPMVWAAAA
jgi:hypothetical protein